MRGLPGTSRTRPRVGRADRTAAWRVAAVAILLALTAAGLRSRGTFSHAPDRALGGASGAVVATVLTVTEGVALVAFVLVLAMARPRRKPKAAAVVTCAFSAAGAAALAAEGLFILAYLLAADAPPGLSRPVPWLRRQAPLLLAGLIAAGAVLAMDAVHLAASAWITVAGLAAAVAAYLIALPARRPQTLPARRPQRSRSRDASSRPDSV